MFVATGKKGTRFKLILGSISPVVSCLRRLEILCVEREEVTAKGLAYPVRTYEVINAISDANAQENSLQTALEGFNINIDFNKLSYTARLEAKEILQKAISKLK